MAQPPAHSDAVQLGWAGPLASGRWLPLRALGWMVALILLVGLSASLPALAAQALGTVPPAEWAAALSVIAAALLAAFLYNWTVGAAEKRPVAELALGPLPLELGAGLAIGAGLMLAVVGVLSVAGWVTVTAQPVTSAATALAAAVQSGLVEELLFRAIILRILWRLTGLPIALGLSAALFGALHLANPNASAFAAVAIALEAGVMLGAFYALTGRLWLSVGVHAAWNWTQGWLLGAAVSGTSVFAGGPFRTTANPAAPEWVSGGAFGPEASVVALLLCTGVGAYVLWRAWPVTLAEPPAGGAEPPTGEAEPEWLTLPADPGT